jgi:hypothetical protein
MTEHLPIQRWTKIFTRHPASEVLPNENGEYVTYADHLAALRACEERVRMERLRDTGNGIKAIGHYEGLREAREAVAALVPSEFWEGIEGRPPQWWIVKAEAIAAIDALREKR